MPTPEEFRAQLLDAMGGERGRVTSNLEVHRTFEPTQVAAVWFTSNRVADGRRICAVLYGQNEDEVGFVEDLCPAATVQSLSSIMKSEPPTTVLAAQATILTYLFPSE